MTYKLFAEHLNNELDNIGLPLLDKERVEAFAKLLKIPKFKAEALLNGYTQPSGDLLVQLSDLLEVDPLWLMGKSDKKK